MRLLACISTGIVVTLLLFSTIVMAEGVGFLNETNSTSNVETCNLTISANTSQENTGEAVNLAGEFIQPIPEDENFYSRNGDSSSALPVVDEIFLELQVAKTSRVSVRTNGKQGDGDSYDPSISSDGRYVAFESLATNLVNKDTNGVYDIFVHDRETGETRRVSVRTNGVQGDDSSYDPSISSDGRYVAFESLASNLVNKDTNSAYDIFVHDRETGETRRVSVRTNGKQGDGGSCNPSISSDGRYVAFYSIATNLVNKDTNGVYDIFLHDRETGKTRRVSIRTNGVQGDSDSYYPSISSDGRYVAFESIATNLVNGDTNGVSDIFVHDRETGKTRRVSVRTNGKQGDNHSHDPSISSDGRYVAFRSWATNLVNNDTNVKCDIFVHDRETGETRRVSVRTNGKQGDGSSYDSSISSDGHYVAFYSFAPNLVNGDTNGVRDIFVAEIDI